MPKTSCIVSFGRNALTMKDDISSIELVTVGFFDDEQQPFADLDDLKTGNLETYATYEPDYWLLDGNYKFMPASPHVGVMSQSISDANGEFPPSEDYSPLLKIVFSDEHDIEGGITLHFSEFSNDYADHIYVSYFDSSSMEIRVDEYTPTSAIFSTNQPVNGVKEVWVEFFSTNKPFRYARLTAIDFDTLTTFAGSEIKTARVVEQIDPMQMELPYNTLDLTLLSSEGDFSIVAPAGFYADLQNRDPLEVHERIGNDIIFIGRFYLDRWESKGANEATFQAYDAIGILDNIPYLGFLGGVDSSPTFAADLIDDIFVDADLDYDLNTFWTTYGTDGNIFPGTSREALHEILFSLYSNSPTRLTAVANSARSNKVRILALQMARDLASFDFTITNADQAKAELTLRPLVTDVQVLGHSRATEASDSNIFNGALAAGDTTIIFEGAADDLGISGGTFVTERANYAVVNVVTPGAVVITGKKWVFPETSITTHNSDAPANAPLNMVKADGSLVAYPLGTMQARADTLIAYYQQRYLLKTTLFAPRAAVGDSVLVDIQGGRQLAGIIERMESDLAGGFVARTEIVGVIVPEV